MTETVQRKTIEDFGKQWARYRSNDGFYGSLALFEDMISPLLTVDELKNSKVAEIGSGTGRIVRMLMAAGVRQVTAVEPSDAYEVLCENVQPYGHRVECIRGIGEAIPQTGSFDFVLSIGVLHHIPSPEPVVRAAFSALRAGGKMIIWVYGHENNRSYLLALKLMRLVSTTLPHAALAGLVWLLHFPLLLYIFLCRFLPLPMRSYMRQVIGKMTSEKRRLVIYDQLNPAFAKYYKRHEVIELMESGGFADIRLYHRHGYSWTAVGTRPLGG